MQERKPIVSVTKDDCDWQFVRGSGKGGQKKNKTNSCVRCFHRPSGAQGKSEDGREQSTNRQIAFRRMTETKEFQTWLKLETSKKMGIEKQIEETVDKQMNNIKVEVKKDGKWVEE